MQSRDAYERQHVVILRDITKTRVIVYKMIVIKRNLKSLQNKFMYQPNDKSDRYNQKQKLIGNINQKIDHVTCHIPCHDARMT